MDELSGKSQALYKAALAGDFEGVRALIVSGATLNIIGKSGDTLLEEWIDELRFSRPVAHEAPMLCLLLQLGTDPNMLGSERTNALTSTSLCMETELIRVLLEAGADPNLPRGFDGSESLYDWVEFDYRYKTWMVNNQEFESVYPPDEPTEADTVSEERWLEYLDCMAVKYNVQRPEHLFLLREYGAKISQEFVSVKSDWSPLKT